MTMEGMDADQVRAFAAKLDSQAGLLSGVISGVNSLVGQLPHAWSGHDASEFVGWWTNKHRPALQSVVDSIAGLATSARNNAAAQDVVSGVSGQGGGPSAGDRTTQIFDLWQNGVGVSQQSSAGWSAQSDAQGATHFGVVPISGDAHAQAYADANEQSHATLSRDGAEAGIAAAAGIGATAAASGRIGNQYLSIDGDGDVGVGANARGQASGKINMDGVDLQADGGAFVGGHADANVSGQVGGVGVGVGGHAYAGAGVHVGGEAQVSLEETKVSLSVGAAIGLGVGLNVTIDVKPAQVLDEISKLRLW